MPARNAPETKSTSKAQSKVSAIKGKNKVAKRSGSGRITIKDVAKAAGVSIATVSFVLNNRPGQVISGPVKKKVLKAAQKLKYSPSAAAATLARKQTKNVSIAFYRNDHLITNQFYSFVVQGAIKEAAAQEYNIMFSFIDDEYCDHADLPKVIRERNAEGVLFIHEVSEPLIKELRKMNVATVAVDSHPFIDGLDTVYVNNAHGAELAAAHLLDCGHTEVAMLTSKFDTPSLVERRDGFLKALKTRGIKATQRKNLIYSDELSFQAGYQSALSFLSKRSTLTGIFAANDEMAAGVLRAAHELGRKIPEELAVIGFDDIIMCHYVDPPLTTISCDKEEMGRRAMARLIQIIEKKSDEPSTQVLDVNLVQRGSSGTPVDSHC